MLRVVLYWIGKQPVTPMYITPEQLQELNELQEDLASHFADSNMISGETYWTCVECFAKAKIAELKGELIYEVDKV